ncbi:protein of unknown function DUF477 [Rhodomicrobium vannielii ATCC 17100]|uniref:TPM domain-containing protein n=1 Tax=Rhodomicrobium vannielii (strain ATCC 17100 / DSM 162 / LMG 4299 / NCIMB 10020 / ATH 3.1.1) TaxID=648757 RepID=E3HZ50_RHOVT|nr:TPM domain-containing protein [Rhodomicrobium vannielii]ADP72097.1 protein of unknown function DUF477 [Rhodomicrobium vannielii ATCC 17100]
MSIARRGEHGVPERPRAAAGMALFAGLARLAAALVLLALIAAALGTARAAPTFPPLTGRVVDNANLLSPADKAALNAELAALEAKSSDQLVVFTTPSLQGYPIEDYGYQLGRAWGIGQKATNNGALLIVAPNERKVRIEVGRGLEPQLTDLLSSQIIRNTILPRFKRGDFAGGIKAGVTDIRDVMLGDAEAVKERVAKRPAERRDADETEALITFFIILAIFIFIAWAQSQQGNRPLSTSGPFNRRSGYGGPIVFPGGWDGGRRGGDGGGWSGGGGGDFGGGGASGDW